MNDDINEEELQREAVAFAKQFGHFLKFSPAAKRFLLRLADFLNWWDFKKAIE